MVAVMARTAFLQPALVTLAARHTRRCSRMAPSRAELVQPAVAVAADSTLSGQVRCRQHVNPLARWWSERVTLAEDWYDVAFADTELPLTVDVGVAKGRLLLKMAAMFPTRNFLGLEIREPLVGQANRCAEEAGLSNLFYLACNANVSLGDVLRGVRVGRLESVYVQFCDPWFKKRHAKRRMVKPALVSDIYEALVFSKERDEGEDRERERMVFMQSDVLEVAKEMRTFFDAQEGLHRLTSADTSEDGWLLENPIGVPTEREISVLAKKGSVYRAMYRI